MGSKKREQDQRLRLAEAQDWKCHWCGCLMIPYPKKHGGHLPNDALTLDHLDSRDSPERGQSAGEMRHVAACNKCNHERGKQQHVAVPIEKRRADAKRHPRPPNPWSLG